MVICNSVSYLLVSIVKKRHYCVALQTFLRLLTLFSVKGELSAEIITIDKNNRLKNLKKKLNTGPKKQKVGIDVKIPAHFKKRFIQSCFLEPSYAL